MKKIERIYIVGLLVFGTLTNLVVSEKREDGKLCKTDDQCTSNDCRGNRCGGRADGKFCKRDGQCMSNDCRGNVCEGRPIGSGHAEHWPNQLYKGAFDGTPWPTNTKEAENAGWKKSVNEACVSELGEAWLYKGTRSSMHCVTLYFTAQIGDIPGVLTGLQHEYYGRIMDGLVGRYFSEKKIDQDGNHYHSVAVGFRDSSKYNLCDNSNSLPPINEKYMVIAPDMENLVVPTHETSSDLIENWVEGSCVKTMGFHWFKSAVEGSKDLTYQRNSVVPVNVMYHPGSSIAGLFFFAPEKMQVWDHEICTPALFQKLPGVSFCPADCNFWDVGPGLNQKRIKEPVLASCYAKCNFWDIGPGLTQENCGGPIMMCGNLCDDKCYFEDSYDGFMASSHFAFYPFDTIVCPNGADKGCRNGYDHKNFVYECGW